MRTVKIATFYRFVALEGLEELQARLIALCEAVGIRGTILLAPEGINATIAGPAAGVDRFFETLGKEERFAGLEPRVALSEELPFQRLKVRIKPEIVTYKLETDPTAVVGTYVEPAAWNELIADPEVIVVDTRNDFEVGYGTFRGAINPKTEKFSDFPRFVEEELAGAKKKKIAMFCTGGIRCEKATSHLVAAGFEQVFHLKGGILHYLEAVDREESLWEGECFVFDERESVGPTK